MPKKKHEKKKKKLELKEKSASVLKACNGCGQSLKQTSFSASQLEKGRDRKCNTCKLLAAASLGDVDILRRMVLLGCDPNVAESKTDKTSLMVACEKGRIEAVEFLAEHADVNAYDCFHRPPLSFALPLDKEETRLKVCTALLKHGARPTPKKLFDVQPFLSCSSLSSSSSSSSSSFSSSSSSSPIYTKSYFSLLAIVHQNALDSCDSTVRLLIDNGASTQLLRAERSVLALFPAKCLRAVRKWIEGLFFQKATSCLQNLFDDMGLPKMPCSTIAGYLDFIDMEPNATTDKSRSSLSFTITQS
eukprot:TRINITY_DN647_c1_g5_i2.p1 TRINITY_DN647_c1_g5~~TRINITY_DN647_c1_g5_i2.p1  ORF type:complete len:303 (-),score=44.24 TRINITY_DN647_c1_g5_i2:250-1158(-)